MALMAIVWHYHQHGPQSRVIIDSTFPAALIAFPNLVLCFIADTEIAKCHLLHLLLCIFYIYYVVHGNLLIVRGDKPMQCIVMYVPCMCGSFKRIL